MKMMIEWSNITTILYVRDWRRDKKRVCVRRDKYILQKKCVKIVFVKI